MAGAFGGSAVVVCIFGRVTVTPNPQNQIGATNGLITPLLSSPIPISQAVAPAAGVVSLNQVDGGFAIVCGHLTPAGIQVTQVISQRGISGSTLGVLGPGL